MDTQADMISLPLPQVSVPFVEYRATLQQARLGPPHPNRVVESSSLAAIKFPKVKYLLNDKLLSGHLSESQLEAVLLACNSHMDILNRRRCGMLIGDGAGMGKGEDIFKKVILERNFKKVQMPHYDINPNPTGRTIAGIILENRLCGRKRSIWVSTNFDLFQDAKRDFQNLGLNESQRIQSFQKVYNKKMHSVLDGDYCLFATYASLSGKECGKKLKALKQWLKSTFSGVIALDECHALKSHGSNNHKCLTLLDSMFPNARFVYCSATIAETPGNIEYMKRLGLWGPCTAFPLGFVQLEAVLNKTGFIGMEALALELKHFGRYTARRLDQGCAEYCVEEVPLSKANVRLYNGCAQLWLNILDGVRGAPEKSIFKFRYFWAAHQRFFRLLNLSFKLDWTVSYIRQQLAIDNAVVVGIQSTGYAKLSLNKKKLYSKIPSALFYIIKDVVHQLLDGDAELANDIVQEAKRLDLPPNFLDSLLNEVGIDDVSELTGRNERLVRVGSKFKWEKITDSRILSQKKFMSGRNSVAVITDACSCGISLHASTDCVNQKRRIHMTLELPWSAEKIVQQCGRTLRSSQVSAPKYVLVVTDVAGEKRFAYGISTKLQALGAITQADRTLSVNSLDSFSMGTKEAEMAILYTLQSIGLVILPVLKYPGKDIYDFFRKASTPLLLLGLLQQGEEDLKPKKPITTMKFLNRLLGAQLPIQNEIYNYMMDVYQEVVQQSKHLGTFDQGVLDIGKRTSHVLLCQKFYLGGTKVNLVKVKADQGISFDEVVEMQKRAEYSRYYAVETSGFRYVYALIRFFATGKYFRVYPCRVSNEETSPYHKEAGHSQVSSGIAKKLWNKIFDCGDRCFHRQRSCTDQNYRGRCGVYNRFQLRSMILGMRWSNLRIISRIMENAEVKSLQLVRCQLKDTNLLGLYVPEDKFDVVEQLLGHPD